MNGIWGSSPLTRGALFVLGHQRRGLRLIPAHAGSTEIALPTGVQPGAHPRSRGEH
nr:hypothetical protein HMPREF0276_1795 [Corynebacterium accolens ATCC 49725]